MLVLLPKYLLCLYTIDKEWWQNNCCTNQKLYNGSIHYSAIVFDCIIQYAQGISFFWSFNTEKACARERERESVIFWAHQVLATLDHDCSKCHEVEDKKKRACNVPIYIVMIRLVLQSPPLSLLYLLTKLEEITLK